jgi:hypothetical protein
MVFDHVKSNIVTYIQFYMVGNHVKLNLGDQNHWWCYSSIVSGGDRNCWRHSRGSVMLGGDWLMTAVTTTVVALMTAALTVAAAAELMAVVAITMAMRMAAAV